MSYDAWKLQNDRDADPYGDPQEQPDEPRNPYGRDNPALRDAWDDGYSACASYIDDAIIARTEKAEAENTALKAENETLRNAISLRKTREQ